MESTESSDPDFLAYWSNEGLESIIDIRGVHKEVTWQTLKDPDHACDAVKKLNTIIHGMMLRARFNNQRDYELYAFSVQKGITKKDIEKAFEESPQTMADTIRKIGVCVHSTKRSKAKTVIG